MSERNLITVVVIDDDPLQLRLAEHVLLKNDDTLRVDRVKTYQDPMDALVDLPTDGLTVILCDQDMPNGDGLSWLSDLTKQDVGPVIIFTATGSEEVATNAFRRGASDYVVKDRAFSDPDNLRRQIAETIRRYKLQKRNHNVARELKIANRQLEDRNQRLNEMTETAHRFVDNVAHEFRTPLTVIREFASIIRDGLGGPVTEQQAEYLKYITDASSDLNQMVDDFLDTSKLKARTLRVDRRSASLADIVDHVRPILEGRAQPKSIGITTDLPDDLPRVYCDAEKVGRILTNLVVNAIKFSSQGQTIEIVAKQAPPGSVKVAVRDHGIGIPKEELAGLCERFHQVGDPRQGSGKGFGLGLNIARNLVWLNLGEMQIESKQGEGSAFSFTLPVDEPRYVLEHYAAQLSGADMLADVTMLRIEPTHPLTTASTIVATLTGACQSMDLLLAGEDGRTVIGLGPTTDHDRWIDRLEAAWASSAPEEKKMPLSIVNQGSWPVTKLASSLVPIVLKSLLPEKRCA